MIVADIKTAAPDYLDANILLTSGFRSVLLMPLVSRGRAVGTLNVVSRQPDAFGQPHVAALQPIAEILAVAWVAQQLHMTLGKHRTMEVMSELTLSVAAEINSALQTIIGHCDLIGRGQHDEALQRDLQTIMGQAQRVDRPPRQDAQRRERTAPRDGRHDESGRHPDEPGGGSRRKKFDV